MTPPIITIGGRNSPFAVAVILACVIAGGLGATGGHRGSYAAFSLLDMRLWYLGLFLGGIVALAGMMWSDPITGMLIERVGQFALASMMCAYSVALLGNPAGVGSATSTVVFGLACAARVVQIHIAARHIRAAVQIIDEMKPPS
ncbi:MAG: hypothetical protein M3N43_04880 [Actinomycetota bacterium]|nr:hypothetical protein [Actinomycetota bacterium]